MPSSDYIFRSPFASSIYPIGNPDETLSLLFMINASRPPLKRLPMEILLHVNKEIHTNAIWEDVRARWSARPLRLPWFPEHGDPLKTVQLDLDKRRYYISDPKYPLFEEPADKTSLRMLGRHVSSADLLYRLRCCFPEIIIDALTVDWGVLVMHNKSGTILSFTEYGGGPAMIHTSYREPCPFNDVEISDSKHPLLQEFLADTVRLLNALFETVGESQQFKFYHPAAHADLTNDEHYIAVPHELVPIGLDESVAYNKWYSPIFPPIDLPSSSSLLQDLKYDIKSKRINRLNGIASLTTVISSALLLYRLLRRYPGGEHSNIYETPPITSVWQVRLTHYETGMTIIFMDDRGLFDIRATDGAEKAMSDIETLIECLCG